MMGNVFRLFTAFVLILSVSPPASPYLTPLSDQAVREAYFVGQRHDGTFAILLFDKYTKLLPLPKTGPHISAISVLTPFIQLAQYCDRYSGNFSAQQAALDHRGQEENVQIVVNIFFTESYGRQIILSAGEFSDAAPAVTHRPYDFWKEFQVQVIDGDRRLVPSAFQGHAVYNCFRSSCAMYGATIILDFHAESFPSDSISIRVTPPEGAPVSADFDLTHLR